MAGEDRQRAEVLGARQELPLQRLAHLGVAAFDPGGDATPQCRNLVGESERRDDLSARAVDGGSVAHSFT